MFLCTLLYKIAQVPSDSQKYPYGLNFAFSFWDV